jgi:hypothetical protein
MRYYTIISASRKIVAVASKNTQIMRKSDKLSLTGDAYKAQMTVFATTFPQYDALCDPCPISEVSTTN